jgi:hypothetical protein
MKSRRCCAVASVVSRCFGCWNVFSEDWTELYFVDGVRLDRVLLPVANLFAKLYCCVMYILWRVCLLFLLSE